jgi:hypothetical protein
LNDEVASMPGKILNYYLNEYLLADETFEDDELDDECASYPPDLNKY